MLCARELSRPWERVRGDRCARRKGSQRKKSQRFIDASDVEEEKEQKNSKKPKTPLFTFTESLSSAQTKTQPHRALSLPPFLSNRRKKERKRGKKRRKKLTPELEHEDGHVVGRPGLDRRGHQRPRGLFRAPAGLGDRDGLLVGEAAAAAALDVDEEACGRREGEGR